MICTTQDSVIFRPHGWRKKVEITPFSILMPNPTNPKPKTNANPINLSHPYPNLQTKNSQRCN